MRLGNIFWRKTGSDKRLIERIKLKVTEYFQCSGQGQWVVAETKLEHILQLIAEYYELHADLEKKETRITGRAKHKIEKYPRQAKLLALQTCVETLKGEVVSYRKKRSDKLLESIPNQHELLRTLVNDL